MDETHLLNEAKQIRLFLEKIKKIIASDYDKTKPTPDVNTTIEDIDQISVTTKNFLEKVSKDNTISVELRTKINHELRTPLVPILAYAEMLLDPKFGSLSDEQRKRLEMMRSNIKTLTQTIHDLFNQKNFNVISNKPEENNSHEIRELRQEKKRKEFSIQAILQRLVDVKPVCVKCGRSARQRELNLHHKDGDSSNDDWRNIVIYCRACHNDEHNIVPKSRKV